MKLKKLENFEISKLNYIKDVLIKFLNGDKTLILELNSLYSEDKNFFIDFVSSQKMNLIFLRKIRDYDFVKSDVLFFDYLLDYEKRIKINNLTYLEYLVSVLDIFKNANINLLAYKGLIYSYLAYGDIFSRGPLLDLDLLIEKREDIYKIFNILSDNNEFYFNNKNLKGEDIYWAIRNNKSFEVGYNYKSLDIHYSLEDTFYFFPRANYTWWTDFGIDKIKISNFDFLIPKKELFFITVLFHNLHHDWKHLSMAFDAAYFMKNNTLDWNLIETEIKKIGIKNAINYGLAYVFKITGVEPYSGYFSKLEKTEPNIVKAASNINIFKEDVAMRRAGLSEIPNRLKRMMFFRDTKKDMILSLVKYIFVPKARNYKILKLPKNFYFIYYVFNPFFLVIDRILCFFREKRKYK